MPSVPFGDLIENAEEVNTEAVPIGKYPCRIVEASWSKTKTDKDMLTVVYEIAVGPHKGRKLYNRLTITPDSPKALGFFFKDMETMGATKEQLAANGADWAADAIIGNLVEIVVKHEQYQGRAKAEVQWVNRCTEDIADDGPPPVAGSTPPPATPPAGDTPPPPPFAS